MVEQSLASGAVSSPTEAKVYNLAKGTAPISTGIGFLDHMLDQLYSHAQIGLDYRWCHDEQDHNRNSDKNQKELLAVVGSSVGNALRDLLVDLHQLQDDTGNSHPSSTFACPLDEALTICTLELLKGTSANGKLQSYNLAPYGKYPRATGRTHIGTLQTAAIQCFWEHLAESSGLRITLTKVRGDNAHHIVESSFKAFSRALRNLLDSVDTTVESNTQLEQLYGPLSKNAAASLALQRQGSVQRQTKETSIATTLQFDGGAAGVTVLTGVTTLDHFFRELALAGHFSLAIDCQGDVWIDEHHTAEDVSIAVGQVLNTALGTKAGLNRMWCATCTVNGATVSVTMDLSNRPCLTHNLESLETTEMIGDLCSEMFEHVLDSLVVNARMTVHIVEEAHADNNSSSGADLRDTVTATARALGQALRYCAMVDGRRAGATASSKGTLSV